ncbi:hypothetical protein IWZ01DRAFT_335394 [Phyllosticta capitalensis]
MKFAKELERELVPEWRAKYLNYKVITSGSIGATCPADSGSTAWKEEAQGHLTGFAKCYTADSPGPAQATGAVCTGDLCARATTSRPQGHGTIR